jgi:hypothetical protein
MLGVGTSAAVGVGASTAAAAGIGALKIGVVFGVLVATGVVVANTSPEVVVPPVVVVSTSETGGSTGEYNAPPTTRAVPPASTRAKTTTSTATEVAAPVNVPQQTATTQQAQTATRADTPRVAATSAPVEVEIPQARAGLVVTGADTGSGGVCAPAVSGTAEPGTSVTVANTRGSATVTADSSGRWQTGRLSWAQYGTHYLTATDSSGASVRTQYTTLAPPSVGATDSNGTLKVTVVGSPGLKVSLSLDGKSLGTVTIGGGGTASASYAGRATAGGHTLTASYSSGSCSGPASSYSFKV